MVISQPRADASQHALRSPAPEEAAPGFVSDPDPVAPPRPARRRPGGSSTPCCGHRGTPCWSSARHRVVLLPVHLTGRPRLVALVLDDPADAVRRRQLVLAGEPQGDPRRQHADAAAVRAVHRSALALGQPAGDVHRERPGHRPAGLGLGGCLFLIGRPEVVVEEPAPRRAGLGVGAVCALEPPSFSTAVPSFSSRFST